MASPLKIVKAMLKRETAADLERQIGALKSEASEASAEIDRLTRERLLAANYDDAREIDDRMRRPAWICEHAAALLPDLEQRLAAVRVADQAAAIARHKGRLLELYPRLKAAILAAVDAQELVIAARREAVQELGEGPVSIHLPQIVFQGFLARDLVVDIWQRENDRLIADLARKPQRVVPPPAVVAPVKPKMITATPAVAAPAPRPPRARREAELPADGYAQIIFLRSGVDLGDGELSITGDKVNLPAAAARALVQSGAADYVLPEQDASFAAPAPGNAANGAMS
jgi:hypothetical protein